MSDDSVSRIRPSKSKTSAPIMDRSEPVGVDQPDERGEGGGAKLELPGIHMVEGVDSRVMVVEVPLRIRTKFADGDALEQKGLDVGPRRALCDNVMP